MSVDYQSLAVKGVQALSPYQPGQLYSETQEPGMQVSALT